MSKISFIVWLLLSFLLSACQENDSATNANNSAQTTQQNTQIAQETTPTSPKSTINSPSQQTETLEQTSPISQNTDTHHQEEIDDMSNMQHYIFNPNKTAKTAEDFIDNPAVFEIQYQANGDLNLDGLSDMALVVKYKDDFNIGERYFLVALQDNTGVYHLDKISKHIFEPEYNEYGYKWHNEELVEIDKGVLKTSFYGLGASGTTIAQFIYQEQELALSHLEVFASGAGGSTSVYYDFIKGEMETHNTNTMLEEMPTEINKSPLKQTHYPFEVVNFNKIMVENDPDNH